MILLVTVEPINLDRRYTRKRPTNLSKSDQFIIFRLIDAYEVIE